MYIYTSVPLLISVSRGEKEVEISCVVDAPQYRAIYFVIETTEEPNSARLLSSSSPIRCVDTCRRAWCHSYLPILTYLPTYPPNYTEWTTRSDKRFTYRTTRWIYALACVYDARRIILYRNSPSCSIRAGLCSIFLLFREPRTKNSRSCRYLLHTAYTTPHIAYVASSIFSRGLVPTTNN